ncbi:MAG: TIGR03086 family metal-binding protein [Acidimicrobiia bacterium]
MDADDPVALFERATTHATSVMSAVSPSQLNDATPCTDWNVQQLIDHMVGGADYLQAALAGEPPPARTDRTVGNYRQGLEQLRIGLRTPGGLERTCTSPLGFEWPVGHAVAGTFMDALIHTWDLATATGQDASLDPELVETCIAMFLPDMPERGRASGLVGPAVHVPEDASPQDRLLAAMGRRP